MFVLIDYNKNYSEIIIKLKEQNITPITIFKLTLNGKTQIKEQLIKIQELKQKIKPEYSAIQVQIDKIENSTIGTINNLKNNFDLVIGLGGLNKVNRLFLEDTQIDFLLNPHNVVFRSKMDFIHHFNSGINQILTKFAKEKEIGFIFSLNFTEGKTKNQTKEIGRIAQNIKILRKHDIPIYLNFIIKNLNQIKTKHQLEHIGSLFNLDTQTIKNNSKILENRIIQNKHKESKEHITEGIEIKN